MRVFLTSFSIVFGLHAAQAEEAFEMTPLEIEGERPAEAPEGAETPIFSTVIDAKEHKDRMSSTAELLSAAAGVQTKSMGGLEAFTSVSIRASTSQQVGVFIDGVPVNRALLGSFDFSEIHLNAVERIEIYRGYVPHGLAGANLAGAVNIVTLPPGDRNRFACTASYGSFDTLRLDASHAGSLGRLNWIATAGFTRGEGDFDFLNDNGTPENPLDDKVEPRENNSFNSASLLVKLKYSPSKDAGITVSNESFWRSQGLPGVDYAQAEQSRFSNLWDMPAVLLQMRNLGSGLADAEAKAFGNYRRTAFEDPQAEIGLVRSRSHGIEKSVGASVLTSLYPVSWNTPSLMVAARQESYREKDFIPSEVTHAAQKRTTLAASVQDEISLMEDKLLFVPAAGAELLWGGSATTELLSPRFGVVFAPFGFARFKANAGFSQRAPTFAELYGHQAAIVGNPDLRPERSFNADAGVELEAKRWSVAQDCFAQFALFYRRAEDLIRFIQNSQSTFKAQNIDEAEIKGVEISTGARLAKRLQVSANYAHQIAVNLSSAAHLHGRRIPFFAQDELSLRSEFTFNRFKIFYSFDLTGENYMTESNLPLAAAVPNGGAPLPARPIHSAGLAFSPKAGLKLAAEVKNALDGRYFYYDGYPLPGRSFFLTASYNQ